MGRELSVGAGGKIFVFLFASSQRSPFFETLTRDVCAIDHPNPVTLQHHCPDPVKNAKKKHLLSTEHTGISQNVRLCHIGDGCALFRK